MDYESLKKQMKDIINSAGEDIKMKKICDQMEELLKYDDNLLLKGKVLSQQVACYYRNSEIEKCIEKALQSVEILENEIPCDEYVQVNNILGIISNVKGNPLQAITYYIKAIDYAEKNSISTFRGAIYNNIADLFINSKDYDTALKYLYKSLGERTKDGGPAQRGVSLVYGNLCRCYLGLKDIEKLDETFDKWKDYLEKNSQYILIDEFSRTTIELMINLWKHQNSEFEKNLKNIYDKDASIEPDACKECVVYLRDWIDYGYAKEARNVLEYLKDIIFTGNIKDLQREYYYTMIKLADVLNDIDKSKMVGKYYEIGEEIRNDLQKINNENICEKIKMFEMKKEMQSISSEAQKDSLTQLYNRRVFDEILRNKFEYATKAGGKVGIAFIDIDNFKEYNDTFGHLEGDKCLSFVASVIRKICEKTDSIALRYGGDEFLIVFFNEDCDGITNIIKTIHSEIVASKMSNPKSKHKILTISTGICVEDVCQNTDIYELVIKSDRALYNSKKNRNQIELYR